jgi:DNA-binding MarR family transcriptional regulator
MDNESYRTLKLLDELTQNRHLSQRALSKRLGIALGLTNLYLKRLIKNGYIKVKNIKKNRLIYELTPTGVAKKASLTLGYIQNSFQYYREVRTRTQICFQAVLLGGFKTVVFYGVGEVAEIAYLSLQETGLVLVAVVDDSKEGTEFLGYTVMSSSSLRGMRFDRMIVTSLEADDAVLRLFSRAEIPREKICFLNLGHAFATRTI